MYSYWIGLVVISLGISLVAFIWALKSGQFAEQGRARYLPLSDAMLSQPIERPSQPRIEAYVLLAIVILGALGIAGSLVLSLWHFRG